jgi:hypothetical protein
VLSGVFEFNYEYNAIIRTQCAYDTEVTRIARCQVYDERVSHKVEQSTSNRRAYKNVAFGRWRRAWLNLEAAARSCINVSAQPPSPLLQRIRSHLSRLYGRRLGVALRWQQVPDSACAEESQSDEPHHGFRGPPVAPEHMELPCRRLF